MNAAAQESQTPITRRPTAAKAFEYGLPRLNQPGLHGLMAALRALEDQDPDLDEVVSWLKTSPAAANAVMRNVNSASRSLGVRVMELGKAVLLLGAAGVQAELQAILAQRALDWLMGRSEASRALARGAAMAELARRWAAASNVPVDAVFSNRLRLACLLHEAVRFEPGRLMDYLRETWQVPQEVAEAVVHHADPADSPAQDNPVLALLHAVAAVLRGTALDLGFMDLGGWRRLAGMAHMAGALPRQTVAFVEFAQAA